MKLYENIRVILAGDWVFGYGLWQSITIRRLSFYDETRGYRDGVVERYRDALLDHAGVGPFGAYSRNGDWQRADCAGFLSGVERRTIATALICRWA